MKDKQAIVNGETSKVAFKVMVDQLFAEHKWVTFSWRIGEKRSVDQNSLLHIWLTQLAAHLANCSSKEVTPGMLEGMKRTAKGLFYRETQYDWMVHKVVCPLTKRSRTDYTSSASWKRGEIFLFLNWLQMFGAMQGCVLESKGEHKFFTGEQHVK